MQQQVTAAQRLVEDLQGLRVVAELLKGPHDPAPQPVVAAMLIQDACSLLTAQISTAATPTPADWRSRERAGICDFSVSRPTTW
jgi:hypothetical protein